MQIGIPKESAAQETRVAATPKSVAQLISLGYEVVIESGAGVKAAFPDKAYMEAGARIGTSADVLNSDIITKINEATDVEIAAMKKGSYLISLINAPRNPELLQKLAAAEITTLAMDSVPRISRAQSLDVISSMANIGGYRAVIEAANAFGSFFTGQVTAAGKVPPAKVLVSGAGVAGLAAIGTASSLGAVVRATDIRAEVAEQVESMGAEFVGVEVESQQSSDGYAKEATADYAEAAARMYAEQVKDVDIIITTALIPGLPAPRLITADMVASMKPGSVIVDMAAGMGGNVEGSKPDEVVLTDNDVKIIGYTDLPGRLPTQASQLFSQNIVNLMKLLTPEKNGSLCLNLEDVVQRGMLVTKDGQIMWPPPAVPVSALPKEEEEPQKTSPAQEKAEPKQMSRGFSYAVIAICTCALLALFAISPEGLISHFMVLMLSVVIGFYIIGNVSHSLHTPLMSVTNAISGIIIVACLAGFALIDQSISLFTGTNMAILILSAIGVLLASINIFGGFAVTQRMLKMFRKGE
jgi:NAD(P) transhydrogenase subunit alpha